MPPPPYDSILIIADIEGSSGCWNYNASAFMTPEWPRACLEMSRDVAAVVTALFKAGVKRIVVKDFHRTGYNLLPERIDPRATIISGYHQGAVPGIGDVTGLQAVMFIGLHAASGTAGFLAHTLTSRLQRLELNGHVLPEVVLFAASVAPYGLRPLFFSGCPVACEQAAQVIPHINTHPIDKSVGRSHFDAVTWRRALARSAAEALSNTRVQAVTPEGPFKALITARDGATAARKMAQRWGYVVNGADITVVADDIHTLYERLVRLCYLTPQVLKFLPLALWLYNLKGKLGLMWVRHRLRVDRKR